MNGLVHGCMDYAWITVCYDNREAAAAQLARGEAMRENAARNRHVHECMQYMNG